MERARSLDLGAEREQVGGRSAKASFVIALLHHGTGSRQGGFDLGREMASCEWGVSAPVRGQFGVLLGVQMLLFEET